MSSIFSTLKNHKILPTLIFPNHINKTVPDLNLNVNRIPPQTIKSKEKYILFPLNFYLKPKCPVLQCHLMLFLNLTSKIFKTDKGSYIQLLFFV